MKEKPLFPKKEEVKVKISSPTKDEIYFVAKPKHKKLNIPEKKPNKVNKEEKIVSIPNTNEITEKLENTPVMMVKNIDNIPKPSVKDNLKMRHSYYYYSC